MAGQQQLTSISAAGEQGIEQHHHKQEAKGKEQPKLYTSISFLKKRADISHAEFYHHWSTTHATLALPWMKRHGFRSYTQYHSLPELNAAGVFAPIGPEKIGGDTDILRGYDGAAVIEVATSGSEVPAATMVKPITSSLIPSGSRATPSTMPGASQTRS